MNRSFLCWCFFVVADRSVDSWGSIAGAGSAMQLTAGSCLAAMS